MDQIRRRLTYSNVISSIALFIALGGAAVAATQLPKGSVGAKQLKKNAVRSSKVLDGSLVAADFSKGTLLQGSQGERGPQGAQGPNGEPGSFPATLPSGKTVRGSFHIRTTAAAGEFPGTAIAFGFALSSPPVPHYVKVGDSPPSECPGSAENPEALAGHLCLYEAVANNAEPGTRCVFSTATAGASCGSASRFGVGIQYDGAGAGDFIVWGTWAVTSS